MRVLLLTMALVLAACSDAPPPRPAALRTPQPAGAHDSIASTVFPSHFTIVYTREYGMWLYRSCAVEVSLFLSTDRLTLECINTKNIHEIHIRDLSSLDAIRLRSLAQAADLYGRNHIGEDLTPTDGSFETLRFRPVGGGRAVVLVASGNSSFEDQPARRELVEWFQSLLREEVESRVR